MSRNLGRTDCYFCHGEVVLVEPERLITRDDCGGYYDDRGGGYAYAGAIVASAECKTCLAKYLAWINMTACKGYGSHPYFERSKDAPFFDLSFRSTFNDEPGEEDLPEHTVKMVPVLGSWPRCAACKKRIYHCYGCQCPEEGRLTVEEAAAKRADELAAMVAEERKKTEEGFIRLGEIMAMTRRSSG
jgi:hypothetical protein